MSEWLTKELDSVANIAIGGTPSRAVAKYWANTDGDGECWVSIADLRHRIVGSSKERITQEGVLSSNVKRVSAGTLIMSFKLSIGRAAIAGCDLYTNEAIAAIIPKFGEIEAEYLYYILPPKAANAITDTAVKGSTLNKKTLGQLLLTYPKDGCVQKKIATILQTIDESIEQTEALIEKYSLVKAGMMHDLFTRGLTPAGKLRPPREEAPDLYKETPIGWIPKDWDWGDLENYCSRICVGIVIRPADYYVTEGVPTFRSANVREGRITDSDLVYISTKSNAILHKSQVRKGDILTVRTGYPGTSAVVPEEFDGCNCVDILISTPTGAISSEFLCYWINSSFGKGQVLSGQGGLAQQHFNVGEMRELIVVKPCEDEQGKITRRFDAVVTKIETQKELLKKYKLQKAGLMHDLLTGEVPVHVDEPEAANV